MAQSDYDTNDIALLEDLVQRADRRVEAQLQTAIAADQRAMTFAGFLAAASAVLGSAAASVLTGTSISHRLGEIALWAGSVTLVTMAVVVIAARPSKFYSPGTRPSNWSASIKRGDDAKERWTSVLEDYDQRIAKNEALMSFNGRLITLAGIFLTIGYTICGFALAVHQ